MRKALWYINRYLRFLLREFSRDRCAQAASALTFGTLLSLVPLVALLAWIIRHFYQDFSGIYIDIARFMTPTPELEEIVRVNINAYVDNAATLGVLGLVFFFLVALSMVTQIENVLNDIFHVRKRRGKMRRLAGFWLTLIFVPLLFVASAMLNQFLERALSRNGLMDKTFTDWIMADLLPFLLLTSSAGLAYWVIPHGRVSKRAALAGGLVAAALYHVVRWGFAQYLTMFHAYDRIYGLIGVIPAFLIWLYLVWTVMLIGAEVTFTAQYPWDEELPP